MFSYSFTPCCDTTLPTFFHMKFMHNFLFQQWSPNPSPTVGPAGRRLRQSPFMIPLASFPFATRMGHSHANNTIISSTNLIASTNMAWSLMAPGSREKAQIAMNIWVRI